MKLNDFDLTKALSGEYEVVTRDGRKVEQLFYFDKATQNVAPVHYVVDGELYWANKTGITDWVLPKVGH